MTDHIQPPQATPDVEALFAWWSALEGSASAGTTLGDWDVEPHLDAACFSRRGALGDDAYLVRGQAVTHFGRDHDEVADVYDALVRASSGVRATMRTTAVRRYVRMA